MEWGISKEEFARLTGIPMSTLDRRRRNGRLNADESDRLLRLAALFDRALDLFEGDVEGALWWLDSPQSALGGESPLEFASTEVGVREVEDIIARMSRGLPA